MQCDRKFKVAITDSPFPDNKPFYDVLAQLGAVEVCMSHDVDEKTLIEVCKDADGIIVTYAEMTEKVIGSLEKCRIIARTGVGMNNINIPAATKKGIFLTNVVTPQVPDVANHAVALMLACAKKIVKLNNQVKKGIWDFASAVPVYRLNGRVLGLVGFGNIAREVAKRAKAFEMQVIAFDPYLPGEVFKDAGVTRVDFGELLTKSDFISIHVPLTESTRHMFGPEEFRAMKSSCFIINTARGPIIDEAALVEAIEKKQIAGAGLDVLATEFPGPDHPLFKFDDVVITPHSAYYSEECNLDLQRSAAGEVVRVLQGQRPVSLVNKELLS